MTTPLPAEWPNREHSRFVRAGELEWHVQTMGPAAADRPVLLLLHGTGAATHSWRDLMPLLATEFRVIAPDLPGHGFSRGRIGGGASLPHVAKAIAALLAALDTKPAIIVGHSAGAAVALRLVLDGAVLPDSVIGLSPALLPFPGIAQHLFPTLAKLLFVNPFAPSIFASIARQPGAVEKFMLRSTGSTIDAAGIANYARLFGTPTHCAGAVGMMANWDLTPLKADLPKLKPALLMLHGAKDAAIPVPAVREAASLVPGAELEIIPELGHLAHEEAPADIAARITAFARATVKG